MATPLKRWTRSDVLSGTKKRTRSNVQQKKTRFRNTFMRIASGIQGEDVKVGDGAMAERGRVVKIRWQAVLNRGDEVGAAVSTFRIGDRQVIAGLERGVIGMKVGGIRNLRISPHL